MIPGVRQFAECRISPVLRGYSLANAMLYKQNLLLGALFILLSELFFASMGATVKVVSADLPNQMTVFMRNLFGLLLLLPLVWRNGIGQLRTRIIHLHLLWPGCRPCIVSFMPWQTCRWRRECC